MVIALNPDIGLRECALKVVAQHLLCVIMQVIKVEEEEWSFVPVGGPLPKARQTVTAFGAAANLVRS